MTSISGGAFSGNTSLTSLTVGSGNPNYQSRDNLVLNKAGDTLVFGAGGLTAVAIPETVETIGEEAFSHSALTSVTIPDSVKTIGYAAFADSALESVTVGNGVTTIDYFAFIDCTALTSLTFTNATAPSLGYDVFDNTPPAL